MNKRILIIDDDVSIGNLVEEVLTGAGHDTLRAYSGTEALLLLKTQQPDLILLDLMLPGLSGEELLPQLSQFPVIVLSAKADVADKVSLLLGGAVDYLTKPFDTKELLARVAVRLRENARSPLAAVYTCGELTLDTASHAVRAAGRPVQLTRTEYAILKLLMQNPGQVLAKSVLLDRISADTPDCTESSLKTHVSNLRGKLRAVSGRDYVEAVWGIGFRLAAES
jgi:two-component system OmpR family response regulator